MRLRIESPLARGLKAAWLFSERTGDLCFDSSLDRNPATLLQFASSPRKGLGIKFPSGLGRVDTTFNGSEYDRLSVVIRARAGTVSTTQYLYDNSLGSTGHRLWADNANVTFSTWYTGAIAYNAVATGVLVLGEWATWAGVHGRTQNTLFKNGALIASSTTYSDADIEDTSTEVHVGENVSSGSNWEGDMDFALFFNRALSPADVLRLVNVGELFEE
jgi:hypothetical protein